jgi:hypothetical protein
MSAKLDKSLDEILSTRRAANDSRRRSTRRSSGRPTTTAPVGGIQKAKPARGNAAKPAQAKGAVGSGDSKIIVSNLVRIPPLSLDLSTKTTSTDRSTHSPRTSRSSRSRYVSDEAIFFCLRTYSARSFPPCYFLPSPPANFLRGRYLATSWDATQARSFP